MADVTFETTFKATCQNLTDYLSVRERIRVLDVSGMGRNIVKTVVTEDEQNFILVVNATGLNDPPT